jgi:hypothetical protein
MARWTRLGCGCRDIYFSVTHCYRTSDSRFIPSSHPKGWFCQLCYFLLCSSLLHVQHLEYLNPLSMNPVLHEIGASELMAFKALGLFLADIARLDLADDAKSSVRALIQCRVFLFHSLIT